MSEQRLDFFEFPKCKKLDNGFIQGEAIASRAGVFQYRNTDGTVRYELRRPDIVFAEDNLKTLKMLVITDDHPVNEFVDASNATKYQVGFTGESIRVDNNNLITTLTITDNNTIKKIEQGKCSLSYGYTCDVIRQDGVYEGMQYTHIQTNLKYNHLSIVNMGRAGAVARIRLDGLSTDAFFYEHDENSITKGDNTMADITDSKHYDHVIAEKTALIGEREARIDKLNAELELIKMKYEDELKKAKSFEKLWSKEKARCDDALNSINKDQINKLVDERSELCLKVSAITEVPIADLLHNSNEELQKMALSYRADEAEREEIGKMSGELLAGAFLMFAKEHFGRNVNKHRIDAAALINSRAHESVGSSRNLLSAAEKLFNKEV